MEKKSRICSVCRKAYDFCPKCKEDSKKELWHFAFCSSNCKDIYDITSSYEGNRVSAQDAKSRLDNLDLSRLEYFGTSYKNSISQIMDSTSTIVEEEMSVNLVEDIEPVAETAENIEANDDVIAEEKSIKKTRVKKSKSVE